MSRLTVTSRVWRGILIMWRNPQVVWYMKDGVCQNDERDGLLPGKTKQKDIDCVLAAVNWAQRQERQSK